MNGVKRIGSRRVLLAGGGVAGLEAMLALRHLAEERVEIELIAPEREFVYRPLSVGGPFGLGQACRFDLAALAKERGVRYQPDALASVEPAIKVARTRAGDELSYDALVVAAGAKATEAIAGALTFWGPAGEVPFRKLLADLEDRRPREIVFVLPPGSGWPLPLYELALLTSTHATSRRITGIGLTIVSHEDAPLELFGARASARVRELLEARGIRFLGDSYPAAVIDGHLALVPRGHVAADRVVSVPHLEGRRIPGLPCDERGFIPVDGFGRIPGLDDVYAAGDGTAFPVKQGGIAAQQADSVAEAIAARAGAPVEPKPFRPVLRGLLLTGREPTFIRAEISGGHGETSTVASHALWWPPGKIAGKYLAPHLAGLAKTELQPPPPLEAAMPVEAELSGPHRLTARDGAAR